MTAKNPTTPVRCDELFRGSKSSSLPDMHLPTAITAIWAFGDMPNLTRTNIVSAPEMIDLTSLHENSGIREIGNFSESVFPKVKYVTTAYKNCKSLQKVGNISLPTVESCPQMFHSCEALTTMGDINLPKCTVAHGMIFGAPKLSESTTITFSSDVAEIGNMASLPNELKAQSTRNWAPRLRFIDAAGNETPVTTPGKLDCNGAFAHRGQINSFPFPYTIQGADQSSFLTRLHGKNYSHTFYDTQIALNDGTKDKSMKYEFVHATACDGVFGAVYPWTPATEICRINFLGPDVFAIGAVNPPPGQNPPGVLRGLACGITNGYTPSSDPANNKIFYLPRIFKDGAPRAIEFWLYKDQGDQMISNAFHFGGPNELSEGQNLDLYMRGNENTRYDWSMKIYNSVLAGNDLMRFAALSLYHMTIKMSIVRKLIESPASPTGYKRVTFHTNVTIVNDEGATIPRPGIRVYVNCIGLDAASKAILRGKTHPNITYENL